MKCISLSYIAYLIKVYDILVSNSFKYIGLKLKPPAQNALESKYSIHVQLKTYFSVRK